MLDQPLVFALTLCATLAGARPPGLAGSLPPASGMRIQGAGHVSPFAGTVVSDVPGVVTGRRSKGFFLQDPEPDANPRELRSPLCLHLLRA